MRVAPVAGVDDVDFLVDVAGDEMRRPALAMADNKHVRLHGRQICDDTLIARLMTSADKRLAAISKVVRVRVDGSKKRLKIALPRSRGTFLTSRWVTPTNDSAVSRI